MTVGIRHAFNFASIKGAVLVWVVVLSLLLLGVGLRGEGTRGKVLQIGGQVTYLQLQASRVPCVNAGTHECVSQARRLVRACFADPMCRAAIAAFEQSRKPN